MAAALANMNKTISKPSATSASVAALFTSFVSTLPALIDCERDLAGYCGHDPAFDTWVLEAEAALARTKDACEAILRVAASGEVERRLQRVARLYAKIIASDNPEDVAGLRNHIGLRRWAWMIPGTNADASVHNHRISVSLDALETWLSLEGQFERSTQDGAFPVSPSHRL